MTDASPTLEYARPPPRVTSRRVRSLGVVVGVHGVAVLLGNYWPATFDFLQRLVRGDLVAVMSESWVMLIFYALRVAQITIAAIFAAAGVGMVARARTAWLLPASWCLLGLGIAHIVFATFGVMRWRWNWESASSLVMSWLFIAALPAALLVLRPGRQPGGG